MHVITALFQCLALDQLPVPLLQDTARDHSACDNDASPFWCEFYGSAQELPLERNGLDAHPKG